mmetsp:Transcript_138540/g.345550  ORF Transcript_138540/g.345550 Transcript_138540/m.345550 type:complete len:288 (-) Transcript_138540:722-1585(-)
MATSRRTSRGTRWRASSRAVLMPRSTAEGCALSARSPAHSASPHFSASPPPASGGFALRRRSGRRPPSTAFSSSTTSSAPASSRTAERPGAARGPGRHATRRMSIGRRAWTRVPRVSTPATPTRSHGHAGRLPTAHASSRAAPGPGRSAPSLALAAAGASSASQKQTRGLVALRWSGALGRTTYQRRRSRSPRAGRARCSVAGARSTWSPPPARASRPQAPPSSALWRSCRAAPSRPWSRLRGSARPTSSAARAMRSTTARSPSSTLGTRACPPWSTRPPSSRSGTT